MRSFPAPLLHPQPDGIAGYTPPIQTVKPPNTNPAAAPAPAPTNGGAPATAPAEVKPKIQAFSQGLAGGKRHSDSWKRKTNLTGAGATHVKSFHCKLNSESLEFMDAQINQWLDDHPDYEVKFVTSSVGEWQGKVKEPNLVLTLWV